MNTVWLLISPVVLLVNSAVTNSGAAVGQVLLLALLVGGLDLVEARVGEGQRHGAGEVLDRTRSPRGSRPGRSARAGRRPTGRATPRCRPASRTTRSAGRGGWGPRGVRDLGEGDPAGSGCARSGDWSFVRAGRLPRCVLPRTSAARQCARSLGPPGLRPEDGALGGAGGQKAAQTSSVAVTHTAVEAAAHPLTSTSCVRVTRRARDVKSAHGVRPRCRSARTGSRLPRPAVRPSATGSPLTRCRQGPRPVGGWSSAAVETRRASRADRRADRRLAGAPPASRTAGRSG